MPLRAQYNISSSQESPHLIREQSNSRSGREMVRGGIIPMTGKASRAFVLLCTVYVFYFFSNLSFLHSSIPAKYDGFIYGDAPAKEDSIVVEAFMDPICPDSRDAWPPLKQVFDHYSPRIFLIVHPFPLPYHDNSFVACRALHIANKLNASTAYPLMEFFFKYQGRYYNAPTQEMSKSSIVSDMAKLATSVVGNNSLYSFEEGFEDSDTDSAARTSFKYGCSRGVTGTPYFIVNGFPLPGAGSALSYSEWSKIIDPLLSQQKEMAEEPLHVADD